MPADKSEKSEHNFGKINESYGITYFKGTVIRTHEVFKFNIGTLIRTNGKWLLLCGGYLIVPAMLCAVVSSPWLWWLPDGASNVVCCGL